MKHNARRRNTKLRSLIGICALAAGLSQAQAQQTVEGSVAEIKMHSTGQFFVAVAANNPCQFGSPQTNVLIDPSHAAHELWVNQAKSSLANGHTVSADGQCSGANLQASTFTVTKPVPDINSLSRIGQVSIASITAGTSAGGSRHYVATSSATLATQCGTSSTSPVATIDPANEGLFSLLLTAKIRQQEVILFYRTLTTPFQTPDGETVACEIMSAQFV